VKSVNGALRSRQDAERLQGIVDRIECYDAVVSLVQKLVCATSDRCLLENRSPEMGA